MKNNFTPINIVNFIAAIALLVYVVGRLYAEYNKDKDFIELTTHNISYRETPSFGSGWLPQTATLNFDQIQSVDLIEIRSMFNQDNVNNALMLYSKQGKNKIIGSNLAREDLIKIVLGLKGSIKLSSTLQRLLGDNPDLQESVKNIISKGKELWNKFQAANKSDWSEYK